MNIRTLGVAVFSILLLGSLAPSPVSAEDFDWIMNSISKAGSLSNGDGHHWEFKNSGGGKWEVIGAYGNFATAKPAGVNLVSIDGFPDNWGANGDFKFSRSAGACTLASDHGIHELKWAC